MGDDLTIKGSDGFHRCVHCQGVVDSSFQFCPHCGSPLKPYDFDEGNSTNLSGADPTVHPAGHEVSSSGRLGTSPSERAAFLSSLPPVQFSRNLDGEGSDFITRLGAADDLVAQCEADAKEASADLREANWRTGHELAGRALDDEGRSEYQRALQARSRWEACERALQEARKVQARLLASYEAEASHPIDGGTGGRMYHERSGLGDWE